MLSDAKIPVGVYHTLTQDCFNWSATKHGKGKNLRSVSSRFFLLIIASKSSLLLNEKNVANYCEANYMDIVVGRIVDHWCWRLKYAG
jgi:hypothetical protein